LGSKSPGPAREAHAPRTPPGKDSLLGAIGTALAAAAAIGRHDVVGELAALAGRLAAEERQRSNEAAGVLSLPPSLPKARGHR
jgi:hypothetical protein